MISKVTNVGFKAYAGNQPDRHEEKLFERYFLRSSKALEESKKKELDEGVQYQKKHK